MVEEEVEVAPEAAPEPEAEPEPEPEPEAEPEPEPEAEGMLAWGILSSFEMQQCAPPVTARQTYD